MRAKSWFYGFIAVLCLAPAGCVSTKNAPRDEKVLELRQGRMVLRVDHEYVARVEAIARQNGTRVHWVNPPLRRVERE
jgi:hypothetical protein